MTDASLFFVIVNRGKANALLHKALSLGAQGGTILLGEGTMQSRLMDLLGINSTLKEVLMMAVPLDLGDALFSMLKNEFQLHKKYRGIAFSVPFRQWESGSEEKPLVVERGNSPYVCIMTVLEKGKGVDCMAVARAAGARGGTIIHARGAGVPETFYFPLIIEPQKDMVLIVSPRKGAKAICEAIYTQMGLDKPGAGITFALPVMSTIGLYEERAQEVRA